MGENMTKPLLLGTYTAISICLLISVFTDITFLRYSAIFLSFTLMSLLCYWFSKTGNASLHSPPDEKLFPDNIEGINAELIRLAEFLESVVREDVDIVKQEILQIKGLVNDATKELTDSFYAISENTDEQLNVIYSVSDLLCSNGNSEIFNRLEKIHKLINDSKSNAIRTLQFDDIVIQVSDNSIQYLDNLDRFISEFKKRLEFSVNNPHSPPLVSSKLKKYTDDVNNIRKERPLPDRKAVHQNDLSEGGIELF